MVFRDYFTVYYDYLIFQKIYSSLADKNELVADYIKWTEGWFEEIESKTQNKEIRDSIIVEMKNLQECFQKENK